MKQVLFYLSIALMGLTLGCNGNNEKVLDVQILDAKTYDIPAKFQVSYRVSIKDSTFSEQQLRNVVASFFELAQGKKSKFHPRPTHIFVFVYDRHHSENGSDWIAMQTRTMNEDGQIEIRMPVDINQKSTK